MVGTYYLRVYRVSNTTIIIYTTTYYNVLYSFFLIKLDVTSWF